MMAAGPRDNGRGTAGFPAVSKKTAAGPREKNRGNSRGITTLLTALSKIVLADGLKHAKQYQCAGIALETLTMQEIGGFRPGGFLPLNRSFRQKIFATGK